MKEGQLPSIGDLLKEARATGELSLREVQKATGVDFTHIWNIERGRRNASRDTLDKISSVLGLDRDLVYVAAGFWPPSIPASVGAVDALRQLHSQRLLAPTEPVTHGYPRYHISIVDNKSLIDKSVIGKEVLIS